MSSWYGNKELYKILGTIRKKQYPEKCLVIIVLYYNNKNEKTTGSIDQLQLTEVPLLLTFKDEIVSSKC